MTVTACPAAPRRVVATTFEVSFVIGGEPARVVTVGGCAADVEEAADRLAELVAMFDPRNDMSDVAAINAGAGRAVTCSLETVLLASVVADNMPVDLAVDPRSSTVTLAAGAVLDPGPIAVGLALDMVLCDLESSDIESMEVIGAFVGLGSSARAVGTSPYGGAWDLDRSVTEVWVGRSALDCDGLGGLGEGQRTDARPIELGQACG